MLPDTCQSCGQNSQAPSGSVAFTNCTCNLGYTGPNGGTCIACTAGKYKDTTGAGICTDCGANTYSTATGAAVASTCTNCSSNSVSPSASSLLTDCKCMAGHTGVDGAACTACTAGSYKTTTGSLPCTFCDVNFYSTTVAAVSVVSCVACSANSTSVAGSGSINLCYCIAGYQQSQTHDACIQCQPHD